MKLKSLSKDALQHVLESATGQSWEPEYTFAKPRRWRFDFACPARMIALEIEGGTWTYGRHNRPSGFAKDLEKYDAAMRLGWTVYRVSWAMMDSGQALDTLRILCRSSETENNL